MSITISSFNNYWYSSLESMIKAEPFVILDDKNIFVLENDGACSVITPISTLQNQHQEDDENQVVYFQTERTVIPLIM